MSTDYGYLNFGFNVYGSSLRLGSQVNLIKGIKLKWYDPWGLDSPFYFPNHPWQLTPQEFTDINNSNRPGFNQQRVLFYYTWKDLIDWIFNRWEISDQNGISSTFVSTQSPGGDITSQLCVKLGIKPEDAKEGAKVGFALVTATKSIGKCSYDIDKPGVISSELSAKLAALPADAAKMSDFLVFFNNYGTHYVSYIEVGEILYQVFVYEQDKLKEIVKKIGRDTLEGNEVNAFQQYMLPSSQPGGFAKYAGNLNLFSDNPYLQSFLLKHLKEYPDRWNDKTLFFRALKYLNDTTMIRLVIPINCRLTSISTLITQKEQADAWSYVLQWALYLKYERNINPNFPPVVPDYNYKQLYQSFQSPFITTVSSSQITLNQIYIRLNEFKTLHPENVKQLFIFGDVVELAADMELPGKSVTIVCRKFIANSQPQSALTITLTGEGYDNFKFYCQEFNGAVMVKKTSEHKRLILWGHIYKNDETEVEYERDCRTSPPLELLRLGDKTLYTLGLPLQSAQAIMNYPAGDDILLVAGLFTQWLADILAPATENDPDLVYIRFQALLLLKSNKSKPTNVLTVPILTYDAYQQDIEELMGAVDAFTNVLHDNDMKIKMNLEYEHTHADLEHINENIQKTGNFLMETNKAMSEKEKDILEFYNKVDEKQKTTLNALKKTSKKLKDELEAQQKTVEEANQKLQNAIDAYIAEEIINAIIEFAAAIAGMIAGGAGASNIGKTAKTIEKVIEGAKAAVKIIEAISKIYDIVDSSVHMSIEVEHIKAAQALKDLPKNIDLDTLLNDVLDEKQWEEYDAEVYAAINPITGDVPYANEYLKEAKILSIRMKAYINTASKMAKIQYDQLLNGWQKDIAQKQADRLTELNKTLKLSKLSPLEAEKIDLFELSSIYHSHAQQVILQLVKTLSLQDAALRYYYFQAPTPITSYDILSLKEVIVSQKDKAITALENFPSRPSNLLEPYVCILKGVKVSELIDDRSSMNQAKITSDEYRQYSCGGYHFNIPVDEADLFNYVRVRILEIRMKVDGVELTNSGKLNVRLVTDAHPFYDRGLNREKIEYNTMQQVFENVWDLKTGHCIYSNRTAPEFAKDYMKMTPFTKWRIFLPTGKNNENAGIKFKSDTVDITLSFYLQAIRLSAPELSALLAKKAWKYENGNKNF